MFVVFLEVIPRIFDFKIGNRPIRGLRVWRYNGPTIFLLMEKFSADLAIPTFVAIVTLLTPCNNSPNTFSDPYIGAVSKCVIPCFSAASIILAEVRNSLPPKRRAQPNPKREISTDELGILNTGIMKKYDLPASLQELMR